MLRLLWNWNKTLDVLGILCKTIYSFELFDWVLLATKVFFVLKIRWGHFFIKMEAFCRWKNKKNMKLSKTCIGTIKIPLFFQYSLEFGCIELEKLVHSIFFVFSPTKTNFWVTKDLPCQNVCKFWDHQNGPNSENFAWLYKVPIRLLMIGSREKANTNFLMWPATLHSFVQSDLCPLSRYL